MKKLALILLIFIPSILRAQCAGVTTCTAASGSSSAVQTALNSINLDNTTLNIPAGDFIWATAVNYTQTNSFTLQGAGAISGTGSLSTITGTGTDQTTIEDNLQANAAMLIIVTASGKSFRMTGFHIKYNSANSVVSDTAGVIELAGQSASVRFDHNHIDQLNNVDLYLAGGIQGVIDHNQFDAGFSDENQIRFTDPNWSGPSDQLGDGSWGDSSHFGTSAFMYAETNNFRWVPTTTNTCSGADGHAFAFDAGLDGGRGVFRFNAVGYHVALQTHGTSGGTQQHRGLRALEIYENTLQYTTASGDCFGQVVQLEGGTQLWWGNTVSGFLQYIHADIVRVHNTTYGETPTPNGWGYCGTAQSGTGSNWDQSATGSGYACMDQIGRGGGDLLTGSNFPGIVNSTTGTIAWPHQPLEPMYTWSSTFNCVPSNPCTYYSNNSSAVLVENRDYYNQLPNQDNGATFNGTVGIGQGTLASKPATCTTGVGWWATDQGSWNQSGSGGQGVLYRCSSTNTWTNYYTPFTYPHPLASTTRTAANCTVAAVQAQVNLSVNGDTVIIPACAQTNWTTTLTINVGITLQGAGVGQTIIGDNVFKGTTCNESNAGPAFAWTVSDNSGNTALPTFMRMTGMTIVGVATDPNTCQKGHVTVHGQTHAMRIDHITINPAQTVAIFIDGDIWGVIDHYSITGDFVNGVRVEHLNWNGFSSWDDLWGDASWAAAIQPGSVQGLYMEDSSFTSTDPNFIGGATDCFSGGRLIFRHNTVSMYNNQSHGADSDHRNRACSWQEVYNNTYTYSNVNNLAFINWIRGGTGVFFNNTITASGYSNKIVQVVNCRDASAGCGGGPNYVPWGACNGSGTYDQNSSGGYRCVDQPGAGTSCLLGPNVQDQVTVAACSLNGNVANHWTGNQLNPIYVWNNTLNGSSNNTTSGSDNESLNRDYFVGTARPGYTPFTYPHPLQGGGGPPATPTNLQVPTSTKPLTLTNPNFAGNLTGWSPAACLSYDATHSHTSDGTGSAKAVGCNGIVLTSPVITIDQSFSTIAILSYIKADNAFNGQISVSLKDFTHGALFLQTYKGRTTKQIGPAVGAETAWVQIQSESAFDTYLHGGDKIVFTISISNETAGTLWIDELKFNENYYPISTFLKYPNYRGFLYASPDSQVISGVTEFSPLNTTNSGLTIQLSTVPQCTSGIVKTITPAITSPVTAWTMDTTGLVTLNTTYFLCTSATINGASVTYNYPTGGWPITPKSQAFKAGLTNTFDTTSNAWLHNFGAGQVKTLPLGAFDSWDGTNRTGPTGTGLFSTGGCPVPQASAKLCYETNVAGMGTAAPLALVAHTGNSALFTDYTTLFYNLNLNFNTFSGVNPTTGTDQLTPYLAANTDNAMAHIQIQNNYVGGLISGTTTPSVAAAPTVAGTNGGTLSTGGGANLYVKVTELTMTPDAEPVFDYELTEASATATLAIGSNTAALVTLPTCDIGANGYYVYAAQGNTEPSETAFRRQFDTPWIPCNVPQVTLGTFIDSGDRTNSWDISTVTRAGSLVTVNTVQPTPLACSASGISGTCIRTNSEFTLSGITSTNSDFNGPCLSITIVNANQFTCSSPGTDTSGTGGLGRADQTISNAFPTWMQAGPTVDSSAWSVLASRMTGNTGAAFEYSCDECFSLTMDRNLKQKNVWAPAAADIPTLCAAFPMTYSFTGVREVCDVQGPDPYGYGIAGISDARWALPAGDRTCQAYGLTPNTPAAIASCDVNIVDEWTEEVNRRTYGSRPFIAVLQSFERDGFRGGIYSEMRRQAYKGLLGCQIFGNLGCGIMWWQQGSSSGMERFYYGLGNTNAYSDLAQVNGEINQLSSTWLAPTLDSSTPSPLVGFSTPGVGHVVSGVTMNGAAITTAATNTVCGFTGTWVNGQYANMTNYPFGPVRFVSKQPGGTGTAVTVLATNLCSASSSFTVTFSMPQAALPAGLSSMNVLFESRTLPVTCSSGTCTFTDTWQDLDVHVYQAQATGTTVSFSPAFLSFASQVVGQTSSPLAIIMTNTGAVPVLISGVVATGDFAQTNSCPSTLSVGTNCQINVTFSPTTTGTRNGNVVVTDNAVGSPQSVPLSGTGINTQPGISIGNSGVTIAPGVIFKFK